MTEGVGAAVDGDGRELAARDDVVAGDGVQHEGRRGVVEIDVLERIPVVPGVIAHVCYKRERALETPVASTNCAVHVPSAATTAVAVEPFGDTICTVWPIASDVPFTVTGIVPRGR